MANKVIKGRLAKYPSRSLTFKVIAQGTDSIIHTSTVTTGATGSFSFTVTESVAVATYDIVAYESSTPRGSGVVDFPDGDTAGTYYVNGPTERSTPVVISGAVSLNDETDDEDDIVYFYNQSPTTKVFLTDTDLSATPLDFVIEKEDKTSICQVLSITPGTESVSVSIPSIPVQTDKCFTWSLRYSSTNTVVRSGPAIYKYAPIKA